MSNKMPPIIGLCGKARSGKDTCGTHFMLEHNYIPASFAKILKLGCKTIFGLSDAQVFGDKKEEIDPYWGVSPRQILQFVGTEMFREKIKELLPEYQKDSEFDVPGFWVLALNRWWDSHNNHPIVITDVRFQDEADWVIGNGGILIHLTRPGADGNVGIAGHASEAGISFSEYGDNVYEVLNRGTVPELYEKLNNVIKQYQNRNS